MKTSRIAIIVVLLLTLGHVGNAQDTDLLDARFKKYFKPEKSKLSKNRQVFSWDWKFSYGTEFFGKGRRDYFMLENSSSDTISWNSGINTVSLMSAGFEPRWNLRQHGKNAFGIKLATHFNFSVTDEHPFAEGMLHASQAVFLFYGRGYAGPFNDFSPRGFAINVGFINVFAPIITFEASRKDFHELFSPLPGSRSVTNTLYFLPAIQFDLYNNNPLKHRPGVMSITAGYLNGTFLFRYNFGLPF